MTFVFPILLGGLALVSVPIILHLIRREKPRTLKFPAFRFLLARHKTNLRRLRLRHLVLLAMRVLLLALICLALARPKVFYAGLNLTTDRPIAAILLFDTSPSMDYKTGDGVTRLEEARKRGLEMVDELPDGSRIAVLDTGGVFSTGEWLASKTTARERIAALKTQPASLPVSRALQQGFRLFIDLTASKEEDKVREYPRLLCVFSDRTRAAWEARATLTESADQVPPLLAGLQRARDATPALVELVSELRTKLPPLPGQDYPDQGLIESLKELRDKTGDPALVNSVRGRLRELTKILHDRKDSPTEVKDYHSKLLVGLEAMAGHVRGYHGVFIDVGVEHPFDLAISDIEFPRRAGRARLAFALDEKFVVQVHIQSTGKAIESALVGRVGKKTWKQAVSVQKEERQSVPIEIDCRELGAGTHQLEARLAGSDPLTMNNARVATFVIRQPERILIVADEPERTEVFAKALQALGFSGEVKTPSEFLGAADPKKLNAYKAVFLLGLASPPAALWDMLNGYVQKGGGLGIAPAGAEMKPQAYNEGPAQKLMPAQWTQVITHKQVDAQVDAGVLWDMDRDNILQHPFLVPFRSWKGDNNVDFIRFPRRTVSYWEAKPTSKGATLVHYSDDKARPAILERIPEGDKTGGGHVLLFTTTLDRRDPAWHNYMENSFYVGLVWLGARYLVGEAEEVDFNFITGRGEPVARLPLTPRFGVYTLRGPDVLTSITVEEDQNELRLKQVVGAGNYTLQGGQPDEPGAQTVAGFSLNLPSEESNLSRVPESEIEPVLGHGAIVPVDRKLPLRDSLRGHWGEPLDLLPYLLLLILFILAAENLLANKFYRTEGKA